VLTLGQRVRMALPRISVRPASRRRTICVISTAEGVSLLCRTRQAITWLQTAAAHHVMGIWEATVWRPADYWDRASLCIEQRSPPGALMVIRRQRRYALLGTSWLPPRNSRERGVLHGLLVVRRDSFDLPFRLARRAVGRRNRHGCPRSKFVEAAGMSTSGLS